MGRADRRLSCDARWHAYQQQNATWGAIEREVNAEDVGCGAFFLYGVMLRAPDALMSSVIAWNRFNATRMASWLLRRAASPGALERVATACTDACEHVGHATLSWQLFDNFAVRTLNGFAGWWLPPGGVNASHLAHARDVLAAVRHLHHRSRSSRLHTRTHRHLRGTERMPRCHIVRSRLPRLILSALVSFRLISDLV